MSSQAQAERAKQDFMARIKTFDLYVHDIFPREGARQTWSSWVFLLWEDGDLYYSTYDGWECRNDKVCAVYAIANLRVNDMQLGGFAGLAR